jgi:predicted DNA-binding transcriptional regulator YafY
MQDKLECSAASVERYLTELRDTYNLTINYNREYNGYELEVDEENDIELPSHLFTTQEINALLLIDQIINNLEPGFLEDDTQALKEHLAKIRSKFGADKEGDELSANRIRMINIGKRSGNLKHLSQVTQAVLQGKKITIRYGGRSGNKSRIEKMTEGFSRTLSPQRLTHYRDNWYLDAWCHTQKALRTFAIERISELEIHKTSRKTLSHDALNEHYALTFGIFGGEIKGIAKLKFTPHRSQWVSEEIWHRDQQGTWLDDGSYQLEIPYGSDIELIGDILKYGNHLEVLEPQELREKLISEVRSLLEVYQ